MKIITWNCNMAFRNKAEIILAHQPDILIVPECENLERLQFKDGILKPTSSLWFGEVPYKGMGVFSWSGYKLKLLNVHNSQFQMVVPIAVQGNEFSFTLFAIWANNPKDPDGQYITQVWKAIRHYDSIIKGKKTLLIGDFNSNTIWDKPRREGNHSTVVKQLEAKGIHSLYHRYFNQVQGTEEHPTLYLYRHKDKPYHLDYCFASIDMAERLLSVEVGDFDYWCKYSDHVPVIVKFDSSQFKKSKKQ